VAATFNEHWLFCNVVTVPGITGVNGEPALFSKVISLAAMVYESTQEFGALPAMVGLNDTATDTRLSAPDVSENCKTKFWMAPEPALGVIEVAVAVVVTNDQTGEGFVPAEFLATTIQ
jgi:hypothetical protein